MVSYGAIVLFYFTWLLIKLYYVEGDVDGLAYHLY
jgi:hypothetical protein